MHSLKYFKSRLKNKVAIWLPDIEFQWPIQNFSGTAETLYFMWLKKIATKSIYHKDLTISLEESI